ncbi:MAG: hypothetical protein GKS05_02845 [Nitrospirales bacterium]|nr:hypothetical protein [Nitrospirales bacterium]
MKKERKPYVVYWNNIPAPYIVERLNAVAKRGILDLEVWFNDRTAPGRSWEVVESSWKFQYNYIPCFKIASCRFRFPLLLLKQDIPDILVSTYAEPVFLVGWTIARIRGSVSFPQPRTGAM